MHDTLDALPLVKEGGVYPKSSAANKLLSHKDQVQSFRILASRELREHVFRTGKLGHLAAKEAPTETKLSCVDPDRVERLLLRVSSLKKLNTSIMEELFFNDVIGNVQIDSLIPSIIGSDSYEGADPL